MKPVKFPTHLGAFVFISILTLGCRFGNYKEDFYDDGITGYYETAGLSLEYCVTVEDEVPGTSSTQCQASDPTVLPAFATQFIANPIAVRALNYDEKRAEILNPYFENPIGFPIYYGSSMQIESLLEGSLTYFSTYLGNPCPVFQQVGMEGLLNRSHSKPTSSFGVKIAGRLEAVLVSSTTFDASCNSLLDVVYQCYSDVNACGDPAIRASLQEIIQQELEPYFNAGLLTPANFNRVREMAFELRMD